MYNFFKINDKKFKSIYLSVNFTTEFKQEEAAPIAMLSSILKKVNREFKSEMELELYLSKLYGALFDINIEKIGDLFNVEFKMSFLNKQFLPNQEDVLDKSINLLYTMIYNSKVEDNQFNSKVVEMEKNYLIEKINERKDDKLKYAVIRMEELIAKNDPFGVFVLGREGDARNISGESLYNQYLRLINNASVNVIVSGNLEGYEDMEARLYNVFGEKLKNNPEYLDLRDKMKISIDINGFDDNFEKADTAQSVLSLGLGISDHKSDDFYSAYLYNVILGVTPSSKLFSNFREKESLAYTVKSRYYRFKGIIIIYAGIENQNYEKAKKCIYEQLESIKRGDITNEELRAAKESIKSDLKEISDSNISQAKNLFGNLFSFFDHDVNLEEMIKNFEKVTLNDIINIAKRTSEQHIYLLGGEQNAKN